MTEFETASLVLRGLVGAGQIVVVAIGIMVMRGMNRGRTRQFEAQMEAQRREAEARRVESDRREKREDARHAEAMRALDATIKGLEQQGELSRAAIKSLDQQGEWLQAAIKSLDQQGEWLRASVKGMEQQGESLRAAVKGLETVIERTAPKG